MTLDALLSTIVSDLETWAATLGGVVSLSSDLWNTYELLSVSPKGFMLVVQFDTERNVGGIEEVQVMDMQFSVYISAAKGLRLRPNAGLLDEAANGRPALLRLVSMVRERVCSLNHIPNETSEQVQYAAAASVSTPEGMPIAAYRLQFLIQYAPPAWTQRDQPEPEEP